MDILGAIEMDQVSPNHIFAELSDKYGDSVYKFCRSLTYSKEDAEDLYQETFLKVLEQPDKIIEFDNPQGFLFSTALYTWKSWKRKYARRNRIAPVGPLDESTASDFSIEEDLIIREEIRTTRHLVEELPEKFKIPVIMYYASEMSVSEIAVALELPEGTIKSRLFKARAIIRKGLIEIE